MNTSNKTKMTFVLTSSKMGDTRMEDPNMNCWSIAHVLGSVGNLPCKVSNVYF